MTTSKAKHDVREALKNAGAWGNIVSINATMIDNGSAFVVVRFSTGRRNKTTVSAILASLAGDIFSSAQMTHSNRIVLFVRG